MPLTGLDKVDLQKRFKLEIASYTRYSGKNKWNFKINVYEKAQPDVVVKTFDFDYMGEEVAVVETILSNECKAILDEETITIVNRVTMAINKFGRE